MSIHSISAEWKTLLREIRRRAGGRQYHSKPKSISVRSGQIQCSETIKKNLAHKETAH